MRIATLALIHSAAEYCAPVWSRSAHTRLIDKPINDALRLVSGCLRSIPTDNLFVLSGITPTELCRKRATLSLACRAQEPGHLLHDQLTSHPYRGHCQLKSKHLLVLVALKLLRDVLTSQMAHLLTDSSSPNSSLNSSDVQVVKAFASEALDLGLIPSRVKPMTLKSIFTSSLLDLLQLRDSVENKRASLLVVPLGKALSGITPSCRQVDRWLATPKRARTAL